LSEASIGLSVKGVVTAIATEKAVRVLDLLAEASELQQRIGLFGHGYVLRYLDKPGSACLQAIAGVVWGFNSPEWKRSAAYAEKWRQFVEALTAGNANAKLGLD
jgi:hypothetical protein